MSMCRGHVSRVVVLTRVVVFSSFTAVSVTSKYVDIFIWLFEFAFLVCLRDFLIA